MLPPPQIRVHNSHMYVCMYDIVYCKVNYLWIGRHAIIHACITVVSYGGGHPNPTLSREAMIGVITKRLLCSIFTRI